jgi:hypothetical protein
MVRYYHTCAELVAVLIAANRVVTFSRSHLEKDRFQADKLKFEARKSTTIELTYQNLYNCISTNHCKNHIGMCLILQLPIIPKE